jgi:hypothetical protein
MFSQFHKEHSVEILLYLFGGLPPTRGVEILKYEEAVADLLADPQPLFQRQLI